RGRGVAPARRAHRGTAASHPRAARARGRQAVTVPRLQLADELLRRFAAALRAIQLYSKGHPIISANTDGLFNAVQQLHSQAPFTVIGLVGDQVIVDDTPMGKADALGPLMKRLQQSGVERITFDRGVTLDEIRTFVEAISSADLARESGAEA